jgi:trimethylamine--corrinoid protein Co-methyltransferase
MLRVISDDDIQRIHSSSLDILSHVGIQIHHDATLKGLGRAGALVDHEKHLVKMPSDLVEGCIKKFSKSHVLAGRTSENDIRIEAGKTYTRCASGSPYLIDIETRKRRNATSGDVKDFTRLQDAMENISFCGGSPYPSDIPPVIQDVAQIKIMLENTTKHIRFQPFSGNSLSYIVKLAETVVGGEDELKKRPILSCITAPSSPLRYSKEQAEIIAMCGKSGLPAMLGSTPIVGATGPVTLAGSLLLQNAEILGGLCISQVLMPGAPLSYGPRTPTMDMRTGLSSWGSIEFGLAAAAGTQMGRFYGMETDLYGPVSDSKVLDEQAAAERVFNGMLPALAGANIVNGGAVLETILSVSMEQLVIDNEIFGMMFRMLRGIRIDEDTLAQNVIRRVGPGGHYLAQEHTRQHYSSEHFITKVFDRSSREMWEQAGSRDTITAAKRMAKKLLAEHVTTPLDTHTSAQLQTIVDDAKKHLVLEEPRAI